MVFTSIEAIILVHYELGEGPGEKAYPCVAWRRRMLDIAGGLDYDGSDI